ncbi:MAG: hypothetical protein M1818_008379 [Claussenomyces sp. TS43310]|nr:MAG: hypothetical protein M1818_008379 [Claussenomyces sp. TS43310]
MAVSNSDVEFWREAIGGAEPCNFPKLNDGHFIPEKRGFEPLGIMIEADQLDSFCQRRSLDPIVVFQVTWALILRCYVGTDSPCFATIKADNNLARGHEGGLTEEKFIYYAKLFSTETLDRVLCDAQEKYVRGRPHQRFSPKVMRSTDDTGLTLFNTLISIDHQPYSHPTAEHIILDEHINYDLGIAIRRSNGILTGSTSYKLSVVSDEQAANIAATFDKILSCILTSSHAFIRDLDVLSNRDQRQIHEFNKKVPHLVDACIHNLIESRALRQPDLPAICSWDGLLTYQELNTISTRLAHHLVDLGVTPGMIVPMCFEKSKWAIVAMLAVLKAGGACLSLDPSYPSSRSQAIIRDSHAEILLTSPLHEEKVRALIRSLVIVTQSLVDKCQPRPDPPCTTVRPTDAAFVMFTSGSTGQPKGIAKSHHAVSTNVEQLPGVLSIGENSRVLQLANYAFVVIFFEILATLYAGGCVCTPSDAQRANDIPAVMRALRVNWAFLTPSLARQLKQEDIAGLKTMVLGGEMVLQSSMDMWAGSVQLIMGYGSTEASICMAGQVAPGRGQNGLIGEGIACRVWIVDAANHNQLAPIGSIGEVVIEGPAVAYGYLHDPQRTREAFFEDPPWLQGRQASGRFYRTGDLGRYSSNWEVITVGRRDTQVKLRGQRVELGEVEFHVRRCWPGTADIAVELVHPRQPTGTTTSVIAAFVRVSDGLDAMEGTDHMDPVALSNFGRQVRQIEIQLLENLPPFLIPTAFVPLKCMPLTISRKTDRRALRQMAAGLSLKQLLSFSVAQEDAHEQRPLTEVELAMARLWAKVLDIPVISITGSDSFIRLGGDSITAMRLVTAAREQGFELSVADIFRTPKLSSSALTIQRSDEHTEWDPDPFSLLPPSLDREELFREISRQCETSKDRVEDVLPCTPLQVGMIASTLKQPRAYFAQHVFPVRRGTDVEKLKSAWNSLILRHEILRARIIQIQSSEFLQVILREGNVSWTYSDDLTAYLDRDISVPMELGSPLSRLALVADSVREEEYIVWSAHHSLHDGWSLPLIQELLSKQYSGSNLPKVTGFKCLIKYLSTFDIEASEEFWRGQFAGSRAVTFPPLVSKLQPLADNFLERKFRHTTSHLNVTIATVLRAAWSILMSRYSDSDDVVFGATLTGRNVPIPGIESMLGATIATVPIRVQIDPGQTIERFLEGLQAQSTEMIPFEHTGLQNIQRLSPELQHACAFQNLLVVQPSFDRTSAGWTDSGFSSKTEMVGATSNLNSYPIVMECFLEADHNIRLVANFDENCIDKGQTERLIHQFEHTFHQLCSRDSQRHIKDIGSVSLRDMKELERLNSVAIEPFGSCIHHEFEKQVQIRPNSGAVHSWDGDLTYQQLNALSNRFAKIFRTLGVKPEVLVPICFNKSLWAIVVMLGILKAGGACVCLDPKHPRSRLQKVIQQLSASVLITSSTLRSLFEDMVETVFVVEPVEMSEPRPVPEGSDRTCPEVHPKNSAFVVFTSGSTGVPKGIVLEHEALCTSAREHGELMRIGPGSRVLQFAAYTFDVSIGDIFTTLMRGGCVCVPSEEERMNDMAGVINRMQINQAYLTASVADILSPADVPDLKILSVGGEAVKNGTVQTWAGKVLLINIYGPAECTIWCAGKPGLDLSSHPGDIGYGIGATLWVVDPCNHDRLAPMGTVGELLIQGPLLARGYLGDLIKTEASFIEDPVWLDQVYKDQNEKGTRRMYKSGDLARYNSDGSIRFIGRKDRQIKLRGQRIEIGEVEHHIKAFFSSTAATTVDVVRPSGAQDSPFLAAFVSFNSSDQSKAAKSKVDIAWSEKRRLERVTRDIVPRLSSLLPHYMIPSVFMPINFLPFTVSGKTDRKQLIELAAGLSPSQLAHFRTAHGKKRPASSRTERILVELWASILKLNTDFIGIDDDFFSLGGDSIDAMRLVALCRQQGLHLTVANIFRHSTLSQVALCCVGIDETQTRVSRRKCFNFGLLSNDQRTQEILKIAKLQYDLETDVIEDIYPCLPLQDGLMTLTTKQPGAYTARHVLWIPSHIDTKRFKWAWEQIVQTNEALRTRLIQAESSGSFQIVLKPSPILWRGETDLSAYLHEDEQIPMGFGLPTSRFAIINDQAKSRDYFVWTAHHAVYDSFSLSMLLDKLDQELQGVTVQRSSRVSFGAFVENVMGNTQNEQAVDFWQSQFHGIKAADFPEVSKLQQNSQTVVELEHVFSIKSAKQSHSKITISSLLRAAWAMTLSVYSGSTDVNFGTTLSGRNYAFPDLDSLIGATIATVPIRIRLDLNKSIRDFLESVQDQSVDMIPYEHTGLQFIRKLSPDAQQACNFKNILVVQSTYRRSVERAVMGAAEFSLSGDTSKFTTYPLVMECIYQEDQVKVTCNYDTNIITQAHMQRILFQFEHMTQQMSVEQHRKLVDIRCPSSHDLEFMTRWSQKVSPAVDECTPSLIERNIRVYPQSPAVSSWDGNLTYEQLGNLSSRLAARLIGLGIHSEDLVLLCFEKSMWTIVSILAVLKAGGGFVPINLEPRTRFYDIVRQTEAKILLSSASQSEQVYNLLKNLDEKIDVLVVDAAHIEQNMHLHPSAYETPDISPHNTAYVMFTSGSTGKPKGVVIEHSSLSSSLLYHGSAMKLGRKTRALQFTSYTFDVSLTEILATLVHGGCVCVPSGSDRLNNVEEFIRDFKVNWAFFTPSVARLLKPTDVPSLRTMVLGGEAVTPNDCQMWGSLTHLELINGYGPTECCIFCVTGPLFEKSPAGTIGHAVGGAGWIVDVDDHNVLVPVGSPGELLIEGSILSRGYLKDERQTGSAFIKDPAWSHGLGRSRRLYKTGDIVRYDPDESGNILFIRRKDTQIKIHGQRAELGEIEHQLANLSDVRQAVAFFPALGPYKGRIVAVLVLHQLPMQLSRSLRVVSATMKGFVAKKLASIKEGADDSLPEYMVPTAWIVVESIPLSSSDKVDRVAIQEWVTTMTKETFETTENLTASQETNTISHTTPMETLLREVFCKVLNLAPGRVGSNSSFLRLGGDSISAMQVMAQCRKEDVIVTVQDILGCKTLAALTQRTKFAEGSLRAWGGEAKEQLDTPFDLSPIQHMFFELAPEGNNHFNQSFLLRLKTKISFSELERAIAVLVRRHSMLRTRFRDINGHWQQVLTNDVEKSYRLRLHNTQEYETVRYIAEMSQRSLDIEAGPLFVVDLFNSNEGVQMLFLSAHHLVIDLVSWRILLHDLEEQLQRGHISGPTPLPFQNWCQMQAVYIRKHTSLSSTLPFELSATRPEFWGLDTPDNRIKDVIRKTVLVDENTSASLLGDCNKALNTEPVDLFVAVLLYSFHQIFPERSIPTLFNEEHGREPWNDDIDLSETVGWFTVMCPIQLPEHGSGGLLETIRRLKDIRRKIPRKGWSYFTSRYLNGISAHIDKRQQPVEIVFNYLGLYQQLEREDALFEISPLTKQLNHSDLSAEMSRFALFEISAAVEHGKLRLDFAYNCHMCHQDRVSAWIERTRDNYIEAALILNKDVRKFTLSDFPLLSITYQQLDNLVDKTLPDLCLTDPAQIEDIYPCSPIQEGLLLSQLRQPQLYEVQSIVEILPRCEGQKINVGRLQEAWHMIINRHSAMRTIFIPSLSGNGLYDQLVLRTFSPEVLVLQSQNKMDAINELKKSSSAKLLECQPPHRLQICSTPQGEVLCRLDMNHAITDGRSRILLLRDLCLAYEDLLPKTPLLLYSNYVSFLQSKPATSGIEYWKRALDGVESCHFPAMIQGPVDRVEECFVEVQVANAFEIHGFCEAHGVTLSNILLMAWALVLQHYVGTDSACFGYLVSGRDLPLDGIEDAIGPFINMVVFRQRFSKKDSVLGALKRIQQDSIRNTEHQSTPLSEIQHELSPARAQLFNTALSLQKHDSETVSRDNAVTFQDLDGQDLTEYDIMLSILDSPAEISARLGYWTSKISDVAARRIAGTLANTVSCLLDDPSRLVGDLNILSKQDRDQIDIWNASPPARINECVHDLIEQQGVNRHINSVAICSSAQSLTYKALNDRSTQLASRLISMGVGYGIYVPLCFENTIWAVVAILAVLKAGAAFVPLDPTQPLATSEYILREVQADVVLTSSRFSGLLKSLAREVVVDQSSHESLPTVKLPKQANCHGNSAAYVIFTSDITGKPKGVVVSHSALSTSAVNIMEAMSVTSSSRVLQFTSYAFDVSLAEIITTLISGGCICVPSDWEKSNDLVRFVNRQRIDHAFLVPTVARSLRPQDVPCLKVLVLWGEMVTPDDAKNWAGSLELIHGYGSTKCCIFCMTALIPEDPKRASNIGRAVGCLSWITNSSDCDRLAAIGAVGELCIEGPSLAKGYLHDEGETATALTIKTKWMVDNDAYPGRRLYRTGDLVRYGQDGTIEFVGRSKAQVTLHERRINFGEIERHLKHSLRDVREVVVDFVRGSTTARDPVLVAFIAIQSDLCPEVKDFAENNIHDSIPGELIPSLTNGLDARLSRVLPTHMIPSAYVPMRHLPLTTSGEVDRKILRELDLKSFLGKATLPEKGNCDAFEPTTEIERILCNTWLQELRIDISCISANSDFFELGGDSIGAMKVANAARTQGLPLTVAMIFQIPILSDLARALEGTELLQDQHTTPLKPFALLEQDGNLETRQSILDHAISECASSLDHIEDIYPCTQLQEGLMALSVKRPGDYIAQHVLRLPADVEVSRFQAAWQAVTASRSNAIMRTRIINTSHSTSFQVVLKEHVQWSYSSSLSQYLGEDKQLPMGFGLPLSRYAIVTDSDGNNYFVWTAHHAIYDAWSLSLILDQLESVLENHNSPNLHQFNRFVKHVNDIEKTRADDFWRSQLSGVIPSSFPVLSSGYTSRKIETLQYNMHFAIPTGSTITTASFLRAAWALLVAQFSESGDVVFGTTLSGRNTSVPGIDGTVGPTITTVPVRVRVHIDETVASFLRGIQNQSTAMMPFEQTGLQNIGRINAGTRLACDFHNLLVISPNKPIRNGKLHILRDADEETSGFTSYPLVMQCTTIDGGAHLVASFDTAALQVVEVRRIMHQFEHLLLELLHQSESPEARLADIKAINPHDEKDIRNRNGFPPQPVESCVHDLIKGSTALSPNRPAVSAWDGEVTYRELNDLSERLAIHLQSLGVKVGDRVPMCFNKSMWMVVAILGVVKAGAIFVPLDPSYPSERMLEIVDQVRARYLIRSPKSCELPFNGRSTCPQTVIVDAPSSNTWPVLDNSSLKSDVDPQDSVYIIFTSGSTGRPKGVELSHAAVAASITYHGQVMDFGEDSRVLQFSSLTFDASIVEIFTTLLYRGCICVPSDAQRMDDLVRFINERRVNWVFFTPSVLKLVQPEQVPSVKTLVVGGEAMGKETVEIWAHKLHLMVGYGPTECCVFCSSHDTRPGDPGAEIGFSVGSCSWIVDPHNDDALCPIGTVGELLVEGPILAKGYFNDATKTRALFIENPAWSDNDRHQRFYKTGDLVRYNPDLSLKYIGRSDTQIKIRGQRIELGEIEYHFRDTKILDDAAVEIVLPANSERGREVLVAFISFAQEKDEHGDLLEYESLVATDLFKQTVQMLLSRLSKALPSHMVPSTFIPLSRLPVNISGKTDRKKLQQIGSQLTKEQLMALTIVKSSLDNPTTAMEKMLQSLWARILDANTNTIGKDDDFFRLGGDSIDAIRMVAMAREEGISLTAAGIFAHPRLSEMARIMSVKEVTVTDIPPFALCPNANLDSIRTEVINQCNIQSTDLEDLYPCTPLQEGLVALSVTQPRVYVAQHIFRIPGHLDIGSFCAAWERTVESLAILRTRIVQTVIFGCWQAVVKDKIAWIFEENLKDYLEMDLQKPMLFGSRLARYAVIEDISLREKTFVLTIHHSLYDGWSLPIVFKMVEQAFDDISVGKRLDSRSVAPFSRFIDYINGIEREAAANFWATQLSNEAVSTYPPTSSRPLADSCFEHAFCLSRQAQSSITVSTIVRAAWGLLLSQYSDSNDIVFGTTTSGRNAPVSEIESVVGPTIATIPVRMLLDNSKSITMFLEEVQNQMTDAINFEHFGLQNMKRLSPGARAACSFQNLMIVQPPQASDSGVFMGLEPVKKPFNNFHTYPLVIECRMASEKLFVTTNFDSRVFDLKQIQRIIHQFQHVVLQLSTEAPDTILSNIEVISPHDIEEIRAWNFVIPETVNICVHEVISHFATEHAASTAICSWDGDLTYQELDQLSVGLACYLGSKLKIRKGSLVPICFDKSLWAVVAMIAILKAGAAFVPLDPNYPISRITDILDILDAKYVLVSSSNINLFTGSKAEGIEIHSSFVRSLPAKALSPIVLTSQDVAYVIFTSGSTAIPKGIEVGHGALATSVKSYGKAINLSPNSRSLQYAAYTSDVSVGDIFATLVHGGCVCIPSEQERDLEVAKAMTTMRVNQACLTSTVAGLISPAEVPLLEILTLGGEAMTTENLARWAESVKLNNVYGAAECTIWCMIKSDLQADSDPTNIGRGLGALCWIVNVDDHDKLAPIGVIGELVIEGPVLALGYLLDVLKTSQVFVEDPVWPANSTNSTKNSRRRVYKTGDLVRYNSDGSINFIGRKDTQVKLRGQRIELRGIEEILWAAPHVQHAMVLLPTSGYCTGQLVAVVSFQDLDFAGKQNEIEGVGAEHKDLVDARMAIISQNLEDQLLKYMIPSMWVALKRVPLKRSGKVDRVQVTGYVEGLRKESFLASTGAKHQEASRMPTTETEKTLQRVWSHVLNLTTDEIGLDDSFYFLGGDSISAMQVVAQSLKQGISVTVQDILKAETISKLAIRTTGQKALLSDKKDFDKPFDLSPIQTMCFSYMASDFGERHAHFNQSFFLRVTREIEPRKLGQALESVVTCHSMLRARFTKDSKGYWSQIVSGKVNDSYHFGVHEVSSASQVAPIIAANQISLDVEKGPVFAAALINMPGSQQRLFLVAHHLVVDLVSWRIILQELEELLETENMSLPDEPFSFQTWCGLQAEEAARAVTFNTSLFDIPTNDFEYWGMTGSRNLYGDVSQTSAELDTDITALLFSSSNNPFRTEPVEILLSALAYSFRHTFGDRNLPAIFSEGHGREPWNSEIDLSRTVGWFTTMSPLYMSCSPDDGVLDYLRFTKDVRRRNLGHNRAYFASQILTAAGRNAYGQHLPCEILFNHLGQYQQLERIGGLLQHEASISIGDIGDLGPQLERFSLIEVSTVVLKSKLQISFSYNRHMLHQDKILQWIDNYKHLLVSTSTHLAQMGPEYTLSDFPLLSTTYEGLRVLLDVKLPQATSAGMKDLEDASTCSPMQQSLLVSQRKKLGYYEVESIFEVTRRDVDETIDPDRLLNAWRKVVNRHAILRTVFLSSSSDDESFDQVVLRQPTVRVSRIKCKDADALHTFCNFPESLDHYDNRPAHRLMICETSEGKVVCRLEISHALIDGTSALILLNDLSLAYDDKLPHGVGASFGNYLSFVSGAAQEQASAYWWRYIAETEPCLFPINTDAHGRQLRTIYAHLDNPKGIGRFCEQHSVTLSCFLHTVWALVLRLYVKSDAISFGYLVSGRDLPVEDIDKIVGPIFNLLLCSSRIQGELRILDVLEQMQADLLNSHANQIGSVTTLCNAPGVPRPLVNTLVNFRKYMLPRVNPSMDLTFSEIAAKDPMEYELCLGIAESVDAIDFSLTYWTPWILDEVAEDIVRTFKNMTALILQNPLETVREVELCYNRIVE